MQKVSAAYVKKVQIGSFGIAAFRIVCPIPALVG